MSSRRRYEILLPLQFNDGTTVPQSLLWETVEELEKRFRAVSWETQIVRGIWQHEGTVFATTTHASYLTLKTPPKIANSSLS